jgi:glycosyltransferase involved in cell wall biosynthesis
VTPWVYVIVSPVKDEEAYIRFTIESVIHQTLRPGLWLLVDDGSIDQTTKIIREYCAKYEWIRLLTLNRRGERRFPAEIQAFNAGYELIEGEAFEFIVKLDCDLSFEPTYFERLLDKFNEDETLGIASGIYLERHGQDWIPIKMPEYHTSGASKVLKSKCFRDIGGFVAARGWDTLDEIRAQIKGWKTRHFSDVNIYHLKKEGSGVGLLSVNSMHGEIYYLVGGSKLFFALKAFHRIAVGRPPVIGGLMMIYGFLKALLQRRKLLVSAEEATFYRRLLHQRIKRRLIAVFGKGNPDTTPSSL